MTARSYGRANSPRFGLASPQPSRNNSELSPTPQSLEETRLATETTSQVYGRRNSPEIGLASSKPWENRSEVLPLSPRKDNYECDVLLELDRADAFVDALFVQNLWRD